MLETKLKRRDSYLAHILVHARDAIISVDAGGIVVTWNKGAERMLGYGEKEAVGTSIYSAIVPEDYKAAFAEGIAKARRSHEPGEVFEAEVLSRDKERIPVLVSITGLADEGGVLADVAVVTATDIREKKLIEEDLIRTERLKAVGELAEGVAHDFNNLLAGILGRVQLLMRQWKQKGIPEESLRSLEVVESLALRGAETVRRIQDFARRQADLAVQGILDLNRILHEVIEVARPLWKDMAHGKGLVYEIEKRFGASLPCAGNAEALRGAFYNLFVNAVEASEEGGEICVETEDREGWVVVRISDKGRGIPAEDRRRVFDPFYTTKTSQGLGLGLSAAYSTVVRHGGEIEVKENPGGGTIVEVRLPAVRDVPGAALAPQERKHILVIEDEQHIRDLLKDILEATGHTVWKAASGREGLELLKKKDVDLVITDLGMPGMTGWEVAKQCKEVKGSVPVLLMTGWDPPPGGQIVSSRYVDGILSKPFKMDEIVEAALFWLSRGSREAWARGKKTEEEPLGKRQGSSSQGGCGERSQET